jgi:hypothetical protein
VIEKLTKTQNQESILTGTEAGGVLVFVVQSALRNDLMDAVFKTLGDAAKDQMTGTRPALLIAGFNGLSREHLLSIAQQDHDAHQQPTALATGVSHFLAAGHRGHVAGVAFLSRGALRPATDNAFDIGGRAYYFPNRESRFWHNDFDGLFAEQNLPQTRT